MGARFDLLTPPVTASVSTGRPTLVVSIHDVSPATEAETRSWIADLEARAVRCTLLVVPGPWRDPVFEDRPDFAAWLAELAARGHEISQHGWEHRATTRSASGRRLVARFAARGCAEFADLDEAEAHRRLTLGRDVLARFGFVPTGFTPPGLLASPGTFAALRALGYSYTTTTAAVHDLVEGRTLRMLGLSHRPGAPGQRLGALLLSKGAPALARSGRSVRIALHPDDLAHPGLREATLAGIDRVMRAGATAVTYDALVRSRRACHPVALRVPSCDRVGEAARSD